MADADSVWYCTREDVKEALDVQETAIANRRIDRAIGMATDSIHGQMQRIFYPLQTTRKFDWPPLPFSGGYPWRLWLDKYEVISVDSLTTGGVALTPAQYFLEPRNEGPPFNFVEINLGTNAAFASGATWQQSMLMTGLFGFTANTNPAGSLAAALSSTTATTATCSDSSSVGVGTILMADTERMIVTGKSQVATGQTLAGNIDNSDATTLVGIQSGAAVTVGEQILIDSEKMLVTDIAGNNLVVKRGVDGSVLASHSATATVFAPRNLTVTRGALGTTAATHSNAAPLSAHAVPPGIRTLAIAETLVELLGEEAGMARMVGSGDNQRAASGGALRDLRSQMFTVFGRKVRHKAV